MAFSSTPRWGTTSAGRRASPRRTAGLLMPQASSPLMRHLAKAMSGKREWGDSTTGDAGYGVPDHADDRRRRTPRLTHREAPAPVVELGMRSVGYRPEPRDPRGLLRDNVDSVRHPVRCRRLTAEER